MFGAAVDKAIMQHCKPLAPQEAGGYINQTGEFVPLPNTHPEPEKAFRFAVPPDALAVVHSHPGGPFAPSEADMIQQIATALPWGICCFDDRHSEVFWFGDGVPVAPLIGRGFRHAVTDCYALIRDFYRAIHDVHLPEYPRDWEWWTEPGKNLYLDGFINAGFREIDINSILPGDVFLASVGKTKTTNHGGVYIGNGLILHHTAAKAEYDPFRLSTVDPAVRWLGYVTKVLRHENDTIDRAVGQRIWT